MNMKLLSIICIALIAIVGIGVAATYFNTNSTEKTNLEITSAANLTKGDLLTVKLTNESGAGIADKTINIILTDSNNNITTFNTTTDSQGIGNISLNDSLGNYTVNATFSGDDNYESSHASQNLTIEETTAQLNGTTSNSATSSNSQSGSSSGSNNYEEEIVYSTDPNSEKSVIDENGHVDQGLVDKYNREAREKYGPIG